MKGFIFNCIGLGVMAAIVAIIIVAIFNAGSDGMISTAVAGVIVP